MDAWLVVLGAALSLTVTLVVQLLVVPRVVRRTRARERWEDDVLRLGDLLAVDLSRGREEAFATWADYWIFRDASDVAGVTQKPEVIRMGMEKRELGEAALARFSALADELRWRAKRVYGRGHDKLSLLEAQAALYAAALPIAPFADWVGENRESCRAEWKREEEQRTKLLGEVLGLTDLVLIVPPHRSRRRPLRFRRHRPKATTPGPTTSGT